jgi:hypothetical protein
VQHFALFGDPERAVDGTGRLGLQRQIGGAATPAHAAAAPVEQRDANAVPRARRHDRFLGLVEIPPGGDAADVLGRIGIADHHFLPAGDPRAIARHGEQRVHDRAGVSQVA